MMLKKIISATLAVLMLTSLSACGRTDSEAGASVTASDGCEKYVSLFSDRVEQMPDSLVLATGEDAERYGVDVSLFADSEGYTVRACEGEVFLLAKTDRGMDRAVRHFTLHGNYDSYSYTYGEGHRIGELTVMGRPIDGFAVVIPDDGDEAMRYGAEELVRYIGLATGVTLPIFTATSYGEADESYANTVTFTVEYPSHGDEAFTIDVEEDGDIRILCGRYRGAIYGAYSLLRDIGWRFIGDGYQYVYEAESVNITEESDRYEEAAVNNRFASAYPINFDLSVGVRLKMHGRYLSDATMSKYGFYGIVAEACHGLDTHRINWGDTYYGLAIEGCQPCFTDEGVLQVIEDHYRNYIDTQLAMGREIGRDLTYLDVAQFDSTAFCQCERCMEVLEEENATCGAVLRMTNRVADIAAEYSPDLSVLMLAYAGTNKAPKVTRPRDNVKISYCIYIGADTGFACGNHPVKSDVEDCYSRGYYDEFEEWKTICSADMLQVWYYPMNCYDIGTMIPTFDTVYHDIKYFIESEVDCVMLCEGQNNDLILLTAICELLWDGDMTEEEYYDFVEECFRIYYGESGEFIYEYINILLHAGDINGCWCNFHDYISDKLDFEYLAASFEYMMELFDKALLYAETESDYERIEVLKAGMMYAGVSATHEDSYVNGTESDRALYEERYRELHRLFKKHSILVWYDFLVGIYAPDEIDLSRAPCEHWTDGAR